MAQDKILLIEDDTYVRELYTVLLKNAGYTVETAIDGEAGLQLVQNNTDASLIILDILMPKRSGMDVLTQLKANPLTKSLPILILTNLSADEIAQKALDMGAYGYIIKASISNDELVAKVKECLAYYEQVKNEGKV